MTNGADRLGLPTAAVVSPAAAGKTGRGSAVTKGLSR